MYYITFCYALFCSISVYACRSSLSVLSSGKNSPAYKGKPALSPYSTKSGVSGAGDSLFSKRSAPGFSAQGSAKDLGVSNSFAESSVDVNIDVKMSFSPPEGALSDDEYSFGGGADSPDKSGGGFDLNASTKSQNQESDDDGFESNQSGINQSTPNQSTHSTHIAEQEAAAAKLLDEEDEIISLEEDIEEDYDVSSTADVVLVYSYFTSIPESFIPCLLNFLTAGRL